MPQSRRGGVGGIAWAAACALYQHRDASLLARDHERTTDILGEVKKQNPPCAHWAGDLVDWEIWEFQNTSFKKISGFKIQLFSFKIPVAKYNCLVSK